MNSLTDEHLLALISDNCPDLVALLDVNGLFVYNNAAHLVRLGRTAESLTAATVFELIHSDDAERFEKTVMASARRRTVFRTCARWMRDSERVAHFESIGKWISADSGRSQYLLLCSRELTDAANIPAGAPDTTEIRQDAALLLGRAEAEKNQIARSIHDDLGQKLTAMSIELSLWKTEVDSGHSRSVSTIREKIAVLSELANGMIGFTRGITATLRPRVLEEFGLVAAIEWHLEKLQKKTHIACGFHAEPEKLDLHGTSAAQIFRLVEEIVASRTADGRCTRLQIRAEKRDGALLLTFEDDGAARQLLPEIQARIRLARGEFEINDEDGVIAILMPLGAE